MSLQNDNETINAEYGSSDETASLLVVATTTPAIVASATPRSIPKLSSINGPTTTSTTTAAKPILTRQECTSSYLISPNLSQAMGGSEESGGAADDESQPQQRLQVQRGRKHSTNATSVPDIDAQCRLDAPTISISNTYRSSHRGSISGYQLTPQPRCRTCRPCDRRASTTPVSSLQMARSVSRDSVRSTMHGHLSPYSISVQSHIPPVLLNASPVSGSRIIRQSSQPEASSYQCCGSQSCSHQAGSSSLRQLRDPSEKIAGIAADSLRISGAMRPFRQVSFCVFLTIFFCLPNATTIFHREMFRQTIHISGVSFCSFKSFVRSECGEAYR